MSRNRLASMKISLTLALAAILTTMIGCQTLDRESTLGDKDPVRAVQLRTQLAAEYIRTGQLDKAKNELDAALKINPRAVETNAMMGVLLQQEGSPNNFKLAERYFLQALEIGKNDPQVHNNYGTYLFQAKRYQDAIQHFNVAGTTLGYEQRFAALENLGRTYLMLGNSEQAEKAFAQALQANSSSIIARLELAELGYLQGRFTEAGEMYEQYVRATGQTNQGARALWIGIRLARARNDELGMKVLVNQLRAQFPDSVEYQRYLQLQEKNAADVIWK